MIKVRENGVVVLVPRYGIEGIVYVCERGARNPFAFDEKAEALTAPGCSLRVFDKVTVLIKVDAARRTAQALARDCGADAAEDVGNFLTLALLSLSPTTPSGSDSRAARRRRASGSSHLSTRLPVPWSTSNSARSQTYLVPFVPEKPFVITSWTPSPAISGGHSRSLPPLQRLHAPMRQPR